jgi:hypothetical protein
VFGLGLGSIYGPPGSSKLIYFLDGELGVELGLGLE